MEKQQIPRRFIDEKTHFSMILASTLLLPAAVAPASAASSGLKQQRETEHFVFYCSDGDVEALDDLEESFEGYYDRVTTDLGRAPSGKTTVNVYPSVQAFHNAMGRPNDPDWCVGEAKHGRVYMTSPLNPGSHHDYGSIIQMVGTKSTPPTFTPNMDFSIQQRIVTFASMG